MSRTSVASNGLSRRKLGLTVALVFAIGIAVMAVPTIVLSFGNAGMAGVLFQLLGPVVYTVVGVVILWNRPGHGVGRLAITIGLFFSVSTALIMATYVIVPPGLVQVNVIGLTANAILIARALADALPLIGLILGGILLVIWFPDGRRTTRLGLVAEIGLVVVLIGFVSIAARDPVLRVIRWTPLVQAIFDLGSLGAGVALFGAYALAVVDLARRYRRAEGVRRTQMRWVLAAVALGVAMVVVILVFGEQVDGLWDLWIVISMLPVLAIAVAITRYHLYDIDRIVSRSISYGVVSVVLFAVFFAVNVSLQRALQPFLGEAPVIVAASTLVVAALFNPLRSRVQRAVDRRFHRARYDAERTVGGFAGRLRDNLDLPTLTGELARTTVETVEPVSTAVWLRAGGRAG